MYNRQKMIISKLSNLWMALDTNTEIAHPLLDEIKKTSSDAYHQHLNKFQPGKEKKLSKLIPGTNTSAHPTNNKDNITNL